MPVTVEWYVLNRINLMVFDGNLSVEEILRASDESKALMDSLPAGSPHKCHVIADLTNLGKMPQSLESFKQALNRPHPNTGWICSINTNTLQNMVTTTLTQLMRVNHKIFKSRAAALQFLIERDPSLAELVPQEDLIES